MKAEIISVGSELTSGQNLDTNSQWLSLRLAEAGIPVGWHTTISDDLSSNIEAFRSARHRAKLVVITGGLGPTQDDLTRQAMAEAFGRDLQLDPGSLEAIREMFVRRGRVMPERNEVQARFPRGSKPIPNAQGTAPGIWMEVEGSVLAALPGVPSEMKPMFLERVLPELRQRGLCGGVLLQRKINTFGMGESQIEEKLLDLTERGHVPEVGITASDAVISLRILARAESRDSARAQIQPVEAVIRERLGELVFGVEDEDLQHAIHAQFRRLGKTLACAESLTGGLIGERVASIPGASDFFLGGIIAYQNRIKEAILGVPREMLADHGEVSGEVAEKMAQGCRRVTGADVAVSTTGVAGPGDLTPEKPAGLVYVGLAWEGGVASFRTNWSGTRDQIRSRAARFALNCVRLHLMREDAGKPTG